MGWKEDQDKDKRPLLTPNEKILYSIGFTLVLLIILALFSHQLTPWIYDSNEYSASLLLQSNDESWFYGKITLTFSDSTEPMNLLFNGPSTETFSNGTTVKHNYRAVSLPRDFEGSVGVTLTYNCTGQDTIVGPIHFNSDSFGLVYNDEKEQQILWRP